MQRATDADSHAEYVLDIYKDIADDDENSTSPLSIRIFGFPWD